MADLIVPPDGPLITFAELFLGRKLSPEERELHENIEKCKEPLAVPWNKVRFFWRLP